EILISESAWEEMTCLFAPSLKCYQQRVVVACRTSCELLSSGLRFHLFHSYSQPLPAQHKR
ncbi:TPA: hypothetical protein ACWW93_005274, partial [Klebsiella pneumoniae]